MTVGLEDLRHTLLFTPPNSPRNAGNAEMDYVCDLFRPESLSLVYKMNEILWA